MSDLRSTAGPPPTRTVLVVAPMLPGPDVSAGDKRLCYMLRMLASRHRVHFYPLHFVPDRDDRHRHLLEEIGVRVWIRPRRQLRTILATLRVDLVIAEFWQAGEAIAGLVRRKQPWAPLLIDSVDIHFARAATAAEAGVALPDHPGDRDREIAAYRDADAVIVITEEDRASLGRVGEFPTTPIIPIIQERATRSRRDRGPEVLFIGGFDHAPNVDGIVWFAERSWPIVRRAVPEARLTVVGSRPKPEVLALHGRDGIEVVGQVPETAPYLDRAAVSVAPLRFGAGMKGKVVEALAHALPVATTRFGVQGLGGRSGESYIVADDPEELALGVAGLLADPDRARRIGEAGQKLVADLCSPESVQETLLELVESSIERKNGPARAPLSWHLSRIAEHAYEAAMAIKPIRTAWDRARSGGRIAAQAETSSIPGAGRTGGPHAI